VVSTNVRKQRTRRALGLLLLFGLIAVLIVASIAIGTRSMSVGTLLHPDQITAAIIRDLRIPRTMLGVLVGAALGVSGTLIQGHTRNPLADPGVLGISSGAACAVVVGFTFFGITSIVGTVVVAFTGAILATLLVFSLTSIGSGRMNPLSVLLGGAALSAVLSSVTSALVLTNEDNLDRMRFWNAGSIAGRDLTISIGIAPFVVLGLVAAFATARQLNPGASIVVSVREKDNVALVRQSGATSVVTSSDTVGRLLGLSAVGPELGAIIQDLLTAGTGLEVQQRQARPSEVGQSPNDVKGEQVIGIIRNGTLRRFYDSTASKIQTGDQLIVVRRAERPDLRDSDD